MKHIILKDSNKHLTAFYIDPKKGYPTLCLFKFHSQGIWHLHLSCLDADYLQSARIVETSPLDLLVCSGHTIDQLIGMKLKG